MMEKLLFQERILIHRHCFWWIWSLVVLSILVRWRRDLPVKMWRRWLTNGTRENSKKNLTWKGRHYAESEADIAIIAGIALHSWHYEFLWGVRYSVSVINMISITADSNVNIKHDSHKHHIMDHGWSVCTAITNADSRSSAQSLPKLLQNICISRWEKGFQW